MKDYGKDQKRKSEARRLLIIGLETKTKAPQGKGSQPSVLNDGQILHRRSDKPSVAQMLGSIRLL